MTAGELALRCAFLWGDAWRDALLGFVERNFGAALIDDVPLWLAERADVPDQVGRMIARWADAKAAAGSFEPDPTTPDPTNPYDGR